VRANRTFDARLLSAGAAEDGQARKPPDPAVQRLVAAALPCLPVTVCDTLVLPQPVARSATTTSAALSTP
jgi:hypothetical protein